MQIRKALKTLFSKAREEEKTIAKEYGHPFLKNDPYFRELIDQIQGAREKVTQQRDARAYHHRVRYPWLFQTMGYKGVPREADLVEMRRLSKIDITEMCRHYRAQAVSMTPWAFVKTEDAKKRFWSKKHMYRLPADVYKCEKSAIQQGSTSKLIDQANEIFNEVNTQGYNFEEIQYMLSQDLDQVGDANVVLSYPNKDWQNIGGIERLRPGAVPGQLEIIDNLQFNKDLDQNGSLMGYYHYPLSGTTSRAGREVHFSKDEMCWMVESPRSYKKYGMGKTESGQARLDLLGLTTDQETNYFVDGAINQGILMLLGFQPNEVTQFRNYYRNQVQGKPGALAIYGSQGAGEKTDAKFLNMSYNYKDLQFLERQEWYMRLQVSNHDLNMVALGLSPAAGSHSRDIVQRMMAFEKAILPRLKKFEYDWNRQVIWPHISEKISLVYNPVMGVDEFERKALIARGLVLDSVWTPNEARGFLGYENTAESFADDLTNPVGMELPYIKAGFLMDALERDGTLLKDEVRAIIVKLFPDVDLGLGPLPDGAGKIPRPIEDKRTSDDDDNPYDSPPSLKPSIDLKSRILDRKKNLDSQTQTYYEDMED